MSKDKGKPVKSIMKDKDPKDAVGLEIGDLVELRGEDTYSWKNLGFTFRTVFGVVDGFSRRRIPTVSLYRRKTGKAVTLGLYMTGWPFEEELLKKVPKGKYTVKE